MGIGQERQSQMVRRALLTDREREVLRGDADDVEDIEQYQSKVISRLRNRVDLLEDDFDLLDEHAPEVADLAREAICPESQPIEERMEQLEQRMNELQNQDGDSE